METDDPERVLPFQLQFDKPLPSHIKIAEWNPEKDLLAMVTEDDSKILLHRFNWQRLWSFSSGKRVSALCWHPDGKAIAVGYEDGAISLLDVENGKLLRSFRSHPVGIVCLNWEEDGKPNDDSGSFSSYEDRTSRFFPPAPRPPRMPGVVSGDSMDDSDDSYWEFSSSSFQRFNVLCSGDKEGNICFRIFGIFLIGAINIHQFSVPISPINKQASLQLLDGFICKVALSKDLRRMTVMCSGEVGKDAVELEGNGVTGYGLHTLMFDTSIFQKRKNELHQFAQQASNIQDLAEVISRSLSVMSKQWSDAIRTFHQKFEPLPALIMSNAMESTPQEEFLSLLCGARTSPAVHQFLVNTLGEVGVKRTSKVVCGAGKELQKIILNHLQPAAEIIAFRIGELRGLSRWRARFRDIGLEEELIDKATEKSGIVLVQVERFIRILSSVEQQFSNFFNWLLKCIKLLMQEPSDQLLPYNSELVVIFLKFLYDQDPVGLLLSASKGDNIIDVDLETLQRVKELVQFGGFSDCDFLRRTLAEEIHQMELSFKEAFEVPFVTISSKIICEDLLPLFALTRTPSSKSVVIPTSVSYYEDPSSSISLNQTNRCGSLDYLSFRVSDGSSLDTPECIGVVRGFMHDGSCLKRGSTSLEAILLSIPPNYDCIDLSLYKDTQIVLLLNGTAGSSDSPEDGCLMVVQISELPYVSILRSECAELWALRQLKDSIVHLQIENEKARIIPHVVIPPLAVSASRGVACIFAARKRALVYILEEDEDEVPDSE